MLSAREIEANLLRTLVQAARTGRCPESDQEADLFRFTAQLLKTWHPNEASRLDAAAANHFAQFNVKPRSFPQVVSDGLIVDVARFRHAMEKGLAGILKW